MKKYPLVLACLGLVSVSLAMPNSRNQNDDSDSGMHPAPRIETTKATRANEDADHWVKVGQDTLKKKLNIKEVFGVAKNVIFFLGDGMSIPTITAARILKGQKVDNLVGGGEEAELHMDTFPYTGLSKTYCVDAQTADSACSATAYLSGVKGNIGTIGVDSNIRLGDCAKQDNITYHTSSLLKWAQDAGKATGIITTTRITHASPAGTYAHIAHRDWESDLAMTLSATYPGDPAVCKDIALQLITDEPGSKFNVILGGGRRAFLPNTTDDIELCYPDDAPDKPCKGYRQDGRNLIEEWKESKKDFKSEYVNDKTGLLGVNVAETDYLLGLFAPSHLEYLDTQEANHDPSLEDMTRVAIEILRKNEKGFVLFVEGGRIDHAHHDTFGQRALWETIEFDNAIKHADDVTDDADTLILVTADHAHTMQIVGYPKRGNDIMGIVELGKDDLPFATINYANGPGYRGYAGGKRFDLSGAGVDLGKIDFRQDTPVNMTAETHGGDDVLIHAKGPYAHLFSGVKQQNYIPHALAYASCIKALGTNMAMAINCSK